MNYLVSICIPTVNRLDYLKEAVASALAQTYENIEVLIGDDGTTEAIQEWGQSLAQRDPPVRYQRNEKNLGLAGNWNALADAARGEFLIIIGDDDRLLPDFVETLIALLEPSGQVAFSNQFLIDAQGNRLETESLQLTMRYHRRDLAPGEIINPAVCVWRNSVPMSAALVRTRDVQRLRFKEDLNTPEIEFFARLAQERGRFFFTPEYLAEYRVHDQSATAGGLRGERLVKYLSPIPVAAEVEPYKREFMARLLVDSVTRCLQQGNRELAREFLHHEYYPRLRFKREKVQGSADDVNGQPLKDAVTRLLQSLCTLLPTCIGSPVYRLLQTTKSQLPGL